MIKKNKTFMQKFYITIYYHLLQFITIPNKYLQRVISIVFKPRTGKKGNKDEQSET